MPTMEKREQEDVFLNWPGKRKPPSTQKLPVQKIEKIQPRSKRTLFSPSHEEIWENRIIWGENKAVMSSLLPTHAGSIDLIYIDPPFATGSDFTVNIDRGEGKKSLEQFAYGDTWGQGLQTYLQMLYERLLIMKELLSPRGSIYVHVDWRVSAHVRLLLDEIMGRENFRNEIIWWYKDPSGYTRSFFRRKHDTIFFYTRSKEYTFEADQVRIPYAPGTVKQAQSKTTSFGRVVQVHPQGKIREDVWEIPIINSQAKERVKYPTQKPEALLEIILKASTKEGDLVADFFAGSGTTAAVAEKLGRKWLVSDLSPLAIHTIKKRLVKMAAEDKGCNDRVQAFSISVLEGYPGQCLKEAGLSWPMEIRETIGEQYGVEPLQENKYLHGRKGEEAILLSSPHGETPDIDRAWEEARNIPGIKALQVIQWETMKKFFPDDARPWLKSLTIPLNMVQKKNPLENLSFHRQAHLALDLQVEGLRLLFRLQDGWPDDGHELLGDLPFPQWFDYWAVDFQYEDDTFCPDWYSFKEAEGGLALQGSYLYDRPGQYRIRVSVVDVLGREHGMIRSVKIG